MRVVDNKQVRRAADLTSLTNANEAMGTAAEIDWEAFLQSDPEYARALRTGLWSVGCMKCWFSEASLQQGEGHIEHFRPKGRLSGTKHGGYKWRTFDWANLRLAHSTVNLRRTDYLKNRKMGKGSYFPLSDSSQRATNAAEEVNETPVLLDPVVASDCLLIVFDDPSGVPKPRWKKEENEWLHRRASDSIDFYHLDEGTWNARRADLMAAIKVLCGQLIEIAQGDPCDEVAYNEKIDEIVKYIGPFAEFSSACLQVVREEGLLEHFATGLRR